MGLKYIEEFKRAFKLAFFMSVGVIIGTGIFPWVMTEDKALANQRLLGTLWGVAGIFAAAVALIFISEIMRTKRLEKRARNAKPKKK